MELLGLYDQAAEVNVTPDRGYAFSLRGIAREWCHATGSSFEDFVLAYGERARRRTSPVTRFLCVMTLRFTVTPHALVL